MSLQGYGYIGRCKFRLRHNSKNVQCSKVSKRKMTKEELIKYGVISKEDIKENNK